MQIVGLVPLGDDIGAGLRALLDDHTRIRAVVRIDVENQFALGSREQRPHVGHALLAVALGHQHFKRRTDALGEGLAGIGESRVIGIGERTHGDRKRPLICLSECCFAENA